MDTPYDPYDFMDEVLSEQREGFIEDLEAMAADNESKE